MNGLGISNMPVDLTALPSAAVERYRQEGIGKNLSDEETKQVSSGIESMFLHMMFNAMKTTIPESGLLDSGISKQFQDMFWFHMAEELAVHGGMGIGKTFYEQYKQSLGRAETAPILETEQ